MWVDQRHQRIIELIATLGRVEADAVAAELRVSRETIRRDLMLLEDKGQLRRIHGGAVRPDPAPERPFQARKRSQMEAKRRIARTAAELVHPGMSCFIDAGTTTAAFAEAIAGIEDVLVLTNSIEIAVHLRGASVKSNVVLLGGCMTLEVPATHGELTIAEINRHRVDLAVLSPVAVHPGAGVTYHELAEAAIARAMMQQAAKTMLLADHTKLDVISRSVVCACKDLSVLVSDASRDAMGSYLAAGVQQVRSAAD